jgi:hypothetical protein
MKQLLILGLAGLAGFFWTIGLGLAFRETGGLGLLALVGAAFAVRFGPSFIQGRFREEFRGAVKNPWLRRYIFLFTYCLFGAAGIMGASGQWASSQYSRIYPYTQAPGNWTLAFLVATLLPAAMLAVWAQSANSGNGTAASSSS